MRVCAFAEAMTAHSSNFMPTLKAGAAKQTVNVRGWRTGGQANCLPIYGCIPDPVTSSPRSTRIQAFPMAAPVPGSPAAMEVVRGQNKAAAANGNAMVASDIVTNGGGSGA